MPRLMISFRLPLATRVASGGRQFQGGGSTMRRAGDRPCASRLRVEVLSTCFPLSPMDGCLYRPMTGGSICTCSMNNSIAIALDQHDKQKEALAACDASLTFTHSPLCRRASRAATPPRSPSRDQGWESRPNPSWARFLQLNEGRLLLRRRVDHAGVGRVADV